MYSAVAALAPDIFPQSFRDEGGRVGLYFEAAAIIVALVLLGQVLELKARSKTGAAIRALLGLAPKKARRIKDGAEEDIPLEHVIVGDILRVRPGEKIPVDGVVTRGLELRGRIHDHRGANPHSESYRRPCHRGYCERHRHTCDEGGEGWI